MNARIVIAVIILVWAAIVAVFGIRQLWPGQQVISDVNDVDIRDYANNANAEVRFTVLGPVVADENFRSGTISISQNLRSATAYRTYTNQVVESTTLGNNTEAFRQFMNALGVAGFGNRLASTQEEVLSSCPQGERYIYELREGGNVIFESWATSCDSRQATFGGSVGLTNRLFRDQIPALNQSDSYQILR